MKGKSKQSHKDQKPQGHQKEEGIAVEGIVTEALANATFRIRLENGHIVLGHIAGKLRKNFIRILPDDRVLVEVSPYDLERGRITFRYK